MELAIKNPVAYFFFSFSLSLSLPLSHPLSLTHTCSFLLSLSLSLPLSLTLTICEKECKKNNRKHQVSNFLLVTKKYILVVTILCLQLNVIRNLNLLASSNQKNWNLNIDNFKIERVLSLLRRPVA